VSRPRPGLPLLLLAGILACALPPRPARASAVQSFRKDLQRIEDRLHRGEWHQASDSCDRVIRDLVNEGAHGKGARPLYGLAFAFRAIAESDLGDESAAVWDWSVAGQMSPQTTAFDLARFGAAGSHLAAILAERAADPDPVYVFDESDDTLKGPKKISAEQPEYPEWARKARIQAVIRIKVEIDRSGRPARVLEMDPSELDAHAAIAVLTLNAIRTWRFEPATRDGQPVRISYELTVSFSLRDAWGRPVSD
jgi:TonB family protein